jgi:predicted HicB family RNase H-like nuclease
VATRLKARPVAKKKQSGSEKRQFNTLVRMEDELAERAKKVAALKGVSLGQYVSDALLPIVERDLQREIKKLSGSDS